MDLDTPRRDAHLPVLGHDRVVDRNVGQEQGQEVPVAVDRRGKERCVESWREVVPLKERRHFNSQHPEGTKHTRTQVSILEDRFSQVIAYQRKCNRQRPTRK